MKILTFIIFSLVLLQNHELYLFKNTLAKEVTLSGLYLSGLHAKRNGSPDEASYFFENALKLDPNNNNLSLQTFIQKLQAGRIDNLSILTGKLSKTSKNLTLIYLTDAIIKYKENRFYESNIEIEKIKDDSFIGYAVPLLNAWSKLPIEKYEDTFEALKPYTEKKEWYNIYNLNCGMINEYYNKKKQALECYKEVSKNIANQPLYFLKITLDGFTRLGKKNEAKKVLSDFKTSRAPSSILNEYLDKYISQNNAQRMTASLGLSEALRTIMHLQMSLNGSGSGVLSLSYGQLALYLNPNLTLLKYDISNLFRKRGQFESAVKVLKSIKKNDPGYTMAQLRIAENLISMDKTSNAIETLVEISINNSSLASPLVSLGDIYRFEEKFIKAIEYYSEAINLSKNNGSPLWYLYYSRGIALERAKKWELAEKDFIKSLELNPGEADVLNYLGYSWLDQKRNIKKAMDMIVLAAEKKPDDGYIIDSLGWAMFLIGDFKKAVTLLERAVALRPGDPTINDHLGDAYWKVGRKLEAIFQWNHAIANIKEEDKEKDIKEKIKNGLK